MKVSITSTLIRAMFFTILFVSFIGSAVFAAPTKENGDQSSLKSDGQTVGSVRQLTDLFKKMLGMLEGGSKRTIQLESHIEGPEMNFKGPSMDFKLVVQGPENDKTKTSKRPVLTPGATSSTTASVTEVIPTSTKIATVEMTTPQTLNTTPSNVGTTMETTTDSGADLNGKIKTLDEFAKSMTKWQQEVDGKLDKNTEWQKQVDQNLKFLGEFRLIAIVMTWSDAWNHCVKLGGRLAFADNESENIGIRGAAGGATVWIDLSYSGSGSIRQKSSWRTSCGRPPRYDGWWSGKPNSENDYRCAVQSYSGGLWYNSSCSTKWAFVCQFGKTC